MHPQLAASISDQISAWAPTLGPQLFYVVVWLLVFSGTGLLIGVFVPFITGDSLVFAAGLVSATTAGTNIWVMALGIGIAAWLGDQVAYTLGRHFGRPYLARRKGKWIQTGILKSDAFYLKWGWWAVVIGRFMPWGRVFVPVIAGISKMNYYKFFSANAVGAVSWGIGLAVTGYFAASIPVVKNASYLIALGFILASIYVGFKNWKAERAAK